MQSMLEKMRKASRSQENMGQDLVDKDFVTMHNIVWKEVYRS